MLTAYDAPGARMVDQAGADLILVGDSVAMVVLGYDDTLQVTVDDIAHHTAAVARTRPDALVVADMPWMSYHVSVGETVQNAATLIRAGAQAVKLEGGRRRLPMIEALVGAEIPVMGHIGLTPQSMHAMGGFKVQGRDARAALDLVDDAKVLAHARMFRDGVGGCARPGGRPGHGDRRRADHRHRCRPRLRRAGAGLPRCPGARAPGVPKFVRRYADLHTEGVAALRHFAADVRSGAFPTVDESYRMADAEAATLGVVRGGLNPAEWRFRRLSRPRPGTSTSWVSHPSATMVVMKDTTINHASARSAGSLGTLLREHDNPFPLPRTRGPGTASVPPGPEEVSACHARL